MATSRSRKKRKRKAVLLVVSQDVFSAWWEGEDGDYDSDDDDEEGGLRTKQPQGVVSVHLTMKPAVEAYKKANQVKPCLLIEWNVKDQTCRPIRQEADLDVPVRISNDPWDDDGYDDEDDEDED